MMKIFFINLIILLIPCIVNTKDPGGKINVRTKRNGEIQKFFGLDCSLQELSTFQVAINYWEQPHVRQKLIDLLKQHHKNAPTLNGEEMLQIWIKEILIEIDEAKNIPQVVKKQISYSIKPLGEELMFFITKIYNILKGQSQGIERYPTVYDYVEKIMWTSYGTIDEVKTFENIFHERVNTNRPIDNLHLFMESAKYCLEKPMETLWPELLNFEKKILIEETRPKNYEASPHRVKYNVERTRYLLSYWSWHFHNKNSSVLKDPENREDHDNLSKNSILTDTIPKTIMKENPEALKYLFNLLETDKQEELLYETVTGLVDHENFLISRHNIDILTFLIKKLPKDEIMNVLKLHNVAILELLIQGWPWRLLFTELVNLSWDFFTTDNYRQLFFNIFKDLVDDYHMYGTLSCTSIEIFIEFLDKHSIYLEEGLVSACWLLPLPNRVKLIGISLISSVIDVEQTIETGIRNDICKTFKKMARGLLLNNNYEVLTGFLNHFLKITEKESFLNPLNLFGYFKNLLWNSDDENDYREIEKFLNWHELIHNEASAIKIKEIVESQKELKEKMELYNNWKNKKVQAEKEEDKVVQSYTFLKG